MRISLLLASALVALIALVAGCSESSGAGTPSGEVQRITVEMSELKYEPMRLSVKAGQPVEVTVRNVSTADHEFFEIFCGLPGHREGGMVGVLTVA